MSRKLGPHQFIKPQYLIFVIVLSGCASNSTSLNKEDSFHTILGSDNVGWTATDSKPQILLDAIIDRLRIRHVRLENKNCNDGFAEHLELNGPIGPESTEAIKRLLPKLRPCLKGNPYSRTVYMSSGGGRLIDGIAMGLLFRQHSVMTRLATGQKCASSCATAFLGGGYRMMAKGSQLIFHAPYLKSYRSIDCSDPLPVEMLRNYYAEVLHPSDRDFLLERTMSYCSASDGWTINGDAAELLGIINEAR